MKLSIDTLAQQGAFTGAPVEREITWRHAGTDVTMTVFVRPLSFHSAVADVRNIKGQKDPAAMRIAASICDETGHAVFTPEDITGEADPARGPLDGNLTMALLVVISEVNSLGKIQTGS